MSNPRVRGPYAKSALRRQQILATAIEVFSEGGTRSGSLREVARRLEMSESNMFYYFGSREALLTAVLEERDREMDAKVVDDPSLDIVETFVERDYGTPGLVKLFIDVAAAAAEPDHPARSFFRERYARLYGEMVEQLQLKVDAGLLPAETDLKQLARWRVAVLDGLQLAWLHGVIDDFRPDVYAFEDFLGNPGRHGPD